jgi:hypothetical protein
MRMIYENRIRVIMFVFSYNLGHAFKLYVLSERSFYSHYIDMHRNHLYHFSY